MRKLIIISLLVMICISFYEIVNTFAIYKSEIQGDYSTSVGIWSIKVNNYDVKNGLVAYNYIKNLQSSGHSAEGKIAPGDTYYFDILIDPEGTDVSIYYDLTLELESETVSTLNDHISISNIECKLINTQNVETVLSGCLVKADNTASRGVIPLSNINLGDTCRIRVYFEWENIEANNELDTQVGQIEDGDFQVNVALEFKQYLGEELESYENSENNENN